VAMDRKQGEEVRVRATPTIYVNGREFSYSEDLAAELNDWIDLELQLLGKAAAKPEEKPESPEAPEKAAPSDDSAEDGKAPAAPSPAAPPPAAPPPAAPPPAAPSPAAPAPAPSPSGAPQ